MSKDIRWSVNMHKRHKIRFTISILVMLSGILGLLFSPFGEPWTIDLLLVLSGFILLITATLLAKDDFDRRHSVEQ